MARRAQIASTSTPPADSVETSAAIRSAVSRQSILDAARQLFSVQGYTATSVSDIVARAGTSVGLPYYHFGSKKQIFMEIWREYQSSQEGHARVAVAEARRSGSAGKDLLLVGIHAYLLGAWRDRDILPMVLSRDTPAGFDAEIRADDVRWQRKNRALLASDDPQLVQAAVVLLGGALRAVTLEFVKCRTDSDAERLIEDALQLISGLLSGLAE